MTMLDTPPTSSPAGAANDHDLLIRMDEKLSIFIKLFSDEQGQWDKERQALWVAVDALKGRLDVASGERKGASWVVSLLMSLPAGVLSALAIALTQR